VSPFSIAWAKGKQKKWRTAMAPNLESSENIDYDSEHTDSHSLDRQTPDDPDYDGLPRSAE
ncbi:MAG: hypothetical protein ACK44Q_11145, partial [Pirellulaceae bacterium]